MKFLSTSFSLVRLPDPSQNFRLFPDFRTWCGEPVRIIISESCFTEDSQKKKKTELVGVSSAVKSVYCLLGVIKDFLYGDWKLLRGNEIVYKLRNFVDLGVPLNYYFGLRTFPVSAAQILANGGKMGGIEERCDDPSKPAEFLGSSEEWHHVRPSSGRREIEARPSLLHSLSRSVQRIKPIITFIFSPNFVGLETRAMQQNDTPFCFPIPKRNKNSGFSHVESGNWDTPRFVLKNRDIPIKSG